MTNAYLVTRCANTHRPLCRRIGPVRPDDMAAHVIRALADQLPIGGLVEGG